MIAGTAIISASNEPFKKILIVEIFKSLFSEFGFNLNDIIFLLYKNHSQSILQKCEYVI